MTTNDFGFCQSPQLDSRNCIVHRDNPGILEDPCRAVQAAWHQSPPDRLQMIDLAARKVGAGRQTMSRPGTGTRESDVARVTATQITAAMTARSRPTALGGNRRVDPAPGSERVAADPLPAVGVPASCLG